MKTAHHRFAVAILALLVLPVPAWGADPIKAELDGARKVTSFAVSPKVAELLKSYCFSCHDSESKKGDIRLDNLATLALKDRLDLLNKMQEQLYLKEMPPRKKKTASEATTFRRG